MQILTADDVPAASALLEQVGLSSGAANIARYLRWQPDAVWGVFTEGALVGTVSLLRYGRVGFVGCMAVAPAEQARGIGRALLEHAHAAGRRAGVTTFLLEATPIGAHLYEKLGYVDEHETWIVTRPTSMPSAPTDVGADRDAILALDRAATGSSRDTMIGSLVDDFAGAVVKTTSLVGYGLVVGDRLGPVIASDPSAGRELIDQLAGACRVATVPVPNAAALDALEANGFTLARSLRRMRLGAPVASRVDWIWTLASAGAG